MFDRIVHGIAVLVTLLPIVVLDRAFAQSQPNAGATEPATFAERFSAITDAPAAAPLQKPGPPAVPAEHSMRAPAPEPFALNVESVTAGGVLNKWNGLVADIRAESEILAHCRDDAQHCPPAAKKFLAVIAEGRAHEGRARVGVINRAINMAIRPMSDLAQWGVVDRWSAPLVTLASGRGDCEDYAIAKYVALRQAGIAEKDVRLIIVRDLASGDDHAVAAARVDEKWIVLDNRRLTLVEDTAMARVQPLFVMDDAGVQRFAPATAEAHRTPAETVAATPATL
jgi:predicted transglutaminase-like cysteine proteinase